MPNSSLTRNLVLVAGVSLCLATIAAPFVGGHPPTLRADRFPRSRRPNLVLVTVDALRADHLGLYGYSRATSPLFDRFWSHAAVFTNAITQAPYTKAAIASLMSGLSPTAHKTVTASVPFGETMSGHVTSTPLSTDILSPDVVTLAETLQAIGYRTLGFTANPFLIAPFGFAQGFDTFEFFPGGDFATADRVVNEALDAVRRSGPGPVFLWVHLMEPHSPYVPPRWAADMFHMTGNVQPIPKEVNIPAWLLPGSPRDLRPYEINYDEEIAAADVAIDVLLRGFGELREAENTFTVLTADHGEQFLDHGGFEHNDTLYDELIHIPLVIQTPEARAVTIGAQVQLLDLYPTLLRFAGTDQAGATEGRDLSRLIYGSGESKPAYSEIYGAASAVRSDGWKLIRWADGRKALFDLLNDPHERSDRLSGNTERARQLESLLSSHLIAAEEQGRDLSSHTVPIDPEVLDRLRALGYTHR